jgi:AcrR family transcriptional regulator
MKRSEGGGLAQIRESRPKGDATRERIYETAMDLFRRKGYAESTMRDIAAEAGVALGAAYYYFGSKDAIVMAFYDQAQIGMEPLIEKAIADTRDLKQRIRGIVEAKLTYFLPNRRLLGALAAHTDPEHPLSPFSAQTRPIRERDIEHFKRALSDCRVRIPADLNAILPRLLWMYQMGLILFWIYDHSPAQKRTRRMIEQSTALVVRLIQLSGFPLMRPARKVVVELVETASGIG